MNFLRSLGWRVLRDPNSAARTFGIGLTKAFSPSNFLTGTRTANKLGDSRFARNVFATAKIKPQKTSDIKLDNFTIRKFASKRTSTENKQAIIFIPGGAFAVKVPALADIHADAFNLLTSMPVYLPDYRLEKFPAAQDDIMETYKKVQEDGFEPENIIFIGDSAGSNLAITTMLRLLEENKPLPGAGVLYSPWTNLDCPTNEGSMVFNAPLDYISGDQIPQAVDNYLGEKKKELVTSPLVSPVKSRRLGELPPLFVTAGSAEILLDQITEFCSSAASQNHHDITLKIVPQEMHSIQLLFPWGQRSAVDVLQSTISWLGAVYPSPSHVCKIHKTAYFLHNSYNPDTELAQFLYSKDESTTVLKEITNLYKASN